jgi:hypothetical protein
MNAEFVDIQMEAKNQAAQKLKMIPWRENQLGKKLELCLFNLAVAKRVWNVPERSPGAFWDILAAEFCSQTELEGYQPVSPRQIRAKYNEIFRRVCLENGWIGPDGSYQKINLSGKAGELSNLAKRVKEIREQTEIVEEGKEESTRLQKKLVANEHSLLRDKKSTNSTQKRKSLDGSVTGDLDSKPPEPPKKSQDDFIQEFMAKKIKKLEAEEKKQETEISKQIYLENLETLTLQEVIETVGLSGEEEEALEDIGFDVIIDVFTEKMESGHFVSAMSEYGLTNKLAARKVFVFLKKEISSPKDGINSHIFTPLSVSSSSTSSTSRVYQFI